ncbi:MAG: hypothetical protein VB050_16405 [Geobacteraceae bacterium]|nr:hypothetical protein [Geobacteraceae bacterium]
MENEWAAGAVKLAALVIGAMALNLPLGYLRRKCERFSFGWYFYVHISIPVIIYMRVRASFSWKVVPLTLGGAIAGQVVGGLLRRRRNQHG